MLKVKEKREKKHSQIIAVSGGKKRFPVEQIKNDSRSDHMSHVHISKNGIPYGHQSEHNDFFFLFDSSPLFYLFDLTTMQSHSVYKNRNVNKKGQRCLKKQNTLNTKKKKTKKH